MPVCDLCPLGTTCVHDTEVAMPAPAYPWYKPAPERAILLDLIAELRKQPRVILSGYMGHIHRTAVDSDVLDSALDRAEARMREATHE